MIAWGEVIDRFRALDHWRVFLIVWAVTIAAAYAVESWPVRTLDAGTLSPIRVERPSALYYGEPRDTSAVARVCCRVIR